jgi:hypothetical protein
VLVGPLGSQNWVPFDGTWNLSGDDNQPPALQLNNPLAANIVQLKARAAVHPGNGIGVRVTEAAIKPIELDPVRDDGQVVAVNGRIHQTDEGYQLLDGDGQFAADLREGSTISLADFSGKVVHLHGTIHADDQPLLIVQETESLFNITLHFQPSDDDEVIEPYKAVTIGGNPASRHALARQIHGYSDEDIQIPPSTLVRAASLSKAAVLTLPQGRTSWRYLDCYGPRFNQARFDEAHFPGDLCPDRGIFNVSRFGNRPTEPVVAVFTSIYDEPDPPVAITFGYNRYQPGAFLVRLPADLPE